MLFLPKSSYSTLPASSFHADNHSTAPRWQREREGLEEDVAAAQSEAVRTRQSSEHDGAAMAQALASAEAAATKRYTNNRTKGYIDYFSSSKQSLLERRMK